MREVRRPGAVGAAPRPKGKPDLADHLPTTSPTHAAQVRPQTERAVTLSLPAPPSVNNLFLTRGRRRVRTPRYRAWQEAAGWELVAHRQGCVGGPWEAHIVLPNTLRGDTDNYSKALLDLLVKHDVVDDDRHCRRPTIEKSGADDAVLVTLRAAP